MTYTKQTWTDGAAGNTPLSAARFNFMENGIAAASNIAPQSMVTLGCFTGYNANGYNTQNNGGPFEDPYVYILNGIVYLEGLVSMVGTSVAAGGSLTFAKLPVGYRPAATVIFIVNIGSGNNSYGRLDVNPDGTLVLLAIGTAMASGAYIGLGGVFFRQVN